MIIKNNYLPLIFGVILSLGGCDTNSATGHHDDAIAHAGPTMNFHRIDDTLATGGHLTTDHSPEELAEQGVSVVIDLRDEPPEGEKERLAAAGIRWLNVPVVWDDPRPEDFAAFSKLMSDNEGEHVLVQCQANYRASAMTYAYRVSQGVPEAEARKDLEVIWTPEGRWEEYLSDILE